MPISRKGFAKEPEGLPARLYGSHSLEGFRLKVHKGDFGKHEGAWDTYTPEMLDYCKQDVEVTGEALVLMQRRIKHYGSL